MFLDIIMGPTEFLTYKKNDFNTRLGFGMSYSLLLFSFIVNLYLFWGTTHVERIFENIMYF